MAWTARGSDEKKEYFDSPEELEKKVTEMVKWIRESKHMIVFTGAGISTSAGIPDFRSGMNTKVETGPGVWELRAHGQSRSKAIKTKDTSKAVPTVTHMMFVKLVEESLLKAVISQNCDGLHRRSGLTTEVLFELHGNSNVEKCKKCKREYLRDFRVRMVHIRGHLTGRKCDDAKCGGDLKDTIVNFGENLPERTLDASFQHAKEADLCLVMGSSLTVTPAADIPAEVGSGSGRLVIVNLQRTPLDHLAALRVFAKCDDFSRLLMEKLALEVPQFWLKRKLSFRTISTGSNTKVAVEQVDIEGHPFSYLKSVVFGGVIGPKTCVPPRDLLECDVRAKGGKVKVELEFQGHYGEPNLTLTFDVTPGKDKMVDVVLSYDPFTGNWEVQRSDEGATAMCEKLQAIKLSPKHPA